MARKTIPELACMLPFYSHNMVDRPCYCLLVRYMLSSSVRPSQAGSTKTAKRMITESTPYGTIYFTLPSNPGVTLVSGCQKYRRNRRHPGAK